MAKEREYSRHQKGIIKRYYENREAISTQRLGEIVSELYLTTSEKKAARLWEQAEKALLVAGANEVWLKKVVADRNLEGLAEIVSKIF